MFDTYLTEMLLEFTLRYPKVVLETVATNRRVDLIEEAIDLAIRVRTVDDEDPQWATRRLKAARGMLVASPGLVAQYGGITTPSALAVVPALGAVEADRRIHWRLVGPNGEVREFILPPRLATEQFSLRLKAALAGLGMTMLPENVANDDLRAGRLVEVLPDWRFPEGYMQAVYVSQRGLSPAVRALLDMLVEFSDRLPI